MTHRELDRALEGADFVLIQIRVGGQAARLRTRRCRSPAAASARRRPARAASPRRCAPCRSCSRSPRASRLLAGRLDRRLHEPGRDRHARAARRRPSRDRAVQRGDRLRALDRAHARRRPRAAAGRPGRPQPPDLGARRVARRARRARRAAGRARRRAGRQAGGLPRRLLEELGAVPSLLPALLLRARRRARRRSARARRRGRRCGRRDRARAARDVRATRRSTDKPALLEQRGGAFYSEAATRLVALAGGRRRATCTWSTCATAARCRASPTTTWSRFPRASDRDGAHPLPQPPLAPELLGLVQHVAAYERLAAEAAVTRDPRSRARRCSRIRWSASGWPRRRAAARRSPRGGDA